MPERTRRRKKARSAGSRKAAKRAQAAELSRETEQKKLLVARTNRDFEAASEAVRSTLQGEKSRIHKYLT